MNGKRCRYCNDWCDPSGPHVCRKCSVTFHVVVRVDRPGKVPVMPWLATAQQAAPWSPYPVGTDDATLAAWEEAYVRMGVLTPEEVAGARELARAGEARR